MVKKKNVWFVNKKKPKRKKKENIKHKKVKVLGTDLNCCILLVNSGAIISNETKKNLCDDETKCS